MIKTIFYEILAHLGFLIPCSKYLPNKRYWDWVMISFIDCHGDGIRCIPTIAEHVDNNKWHTELSDESKSFQEYLDNDCIVTHWRRIPRNFSSLYRNK